ncbi:hypothetical protein FOMPIDRAFT_1026374 [Fomitopsis schrenkii]|uniref:C2H2-type domain-containing protein n=1 Tax=Fomitopsis schrenkii TaxID=2126942 RepID=S8DMP9_FOMSC|nr:hypothetical protein FOMPIDRAFT_1026374 [Fomitopsis schrenkii]
MWTLTLAALLVLAFATLSCSACMRVFARKQDWTSHQRRGHDRSAQSRKRRVGASAHDGNHRWRHGTSRRSHPLRPPTVPVAHMPRKTKRTVPAQGRKHS